MEKPKRNLCDVLEKLSVKSDEDSAPISLSDIPTDPLVQIIDKSDYKEQLILRKVSKPLRSLVDEQNPNCKSIHIILSKRRFNCKFNDQKVIYEKSSGVHRMADEVYKSAHVIKDRAYKEIFSEDIKWTLNNPKLKLDYFEFKNRPGRMSYFKSDNHMEEWKDERFVKLECLLKSLNQQVSTKTLEIDAAHPSNLLRILPFFKPGELQKIIIRNIGYFGWNESSLVLEELKEVEQWMKAVELELHDIVEFPMEYATNFKRFRILYQRLEFNTLDVLGKSFTKLPNFERCLVEIKYTWNLYIEKNVGKEAPPNELTEHVRHLPIPDSNDYLEFQFFQTSVLIEKKKLMA